MCDSCSDGSLPTPLPCLTCQRNQQPHAGVLRSSFNPGDAFPGREERWETGGLVHSMFPIVGSRCLLAQRPVRPGEQPMCVRHLPGPGACVGPPFVSSGTKLLPRRNRGQSHVPPTASQPLRATLCRPGPGRSVEGLRQPAGTSALVCSFVIILGTLSIHLHGGWRGGREQLKAEDPFKWHVLQRCLLSCGCSVTSGPLKVPPCPSPVSTPASQHRIN